MVQTRRGALSTSERPELMESGLGRGLEQWGSSRGGGTRIVEFKSWEKAAEVCLNYFSRVKHRVQTRRGPELMDSGLGTRIVRFKSREAAHINKQDCFQGGDRISRKITYCYGQ